MTEGTKVDIVTRVLAANDRLAEELRRLFASSHVTAVDVMGSPGSGKTLLLEATMPRLACKLRCAAIVGDIATALDATRLARHGVPVVQIETESFGGACHLEASTVAEAVRRLDLDGLDLVFIENVGNLVCPAEFDLGHDARVVVLSVTEGEDKPLKYPLAFREASVVVIGKTDLVPHLDIEMDAIRASLGRVNPSVEVFELSARSGEGMDAWISWLENTCSKKR
jgi:hydrogenase nickel incorporation protein HypB